MGEEGISILLRPHEYYCTSEQSISSLFNRINNVKLLHCKALICSKLEAERILIPTLSGF